MEPDPTPPEQKNPNLSPTREFEEPWVEGFERSEMEREIGESLSQIYNNTLSFANEYSRQLEVLDKEIDLKEEAVKKEKVLMKAVGEREKNVEFHEVFFNKRFGLLHEKEKEFDLKQIQEAQVIRLVLEKQNEELVIRFNEQEKVFQDSLNEKYGELLGELQAAKEKVGLISKLVDEKSCELERTVKEFDMKQALETESRRKEAELMEISCKNFETRKNELREKLSELEKKEEKEREEAREIEEKSKLHDLKEKNLETREKKLDETIKERLSKLEKKEREEAIKIKEKSKLLDLKEKRLDEREIKLALKKNEIKERLENIKAHMRSRLEVGTSSNKGREADSVISTGEKHKSVREHNQNDEERVLDREVRRKARYDSQSEHTSEANTTEIDEVICIDLDDVEDPELYTCPDPEFHHFNKTMESFCVGQVWALYEPRHLMPRYYAVIKRILQSDLSLRVEWLEPEENNENTVACGNFTYGKPDTQSYMAFSHEMHYIKQGNIVSINPRKGETWALFNEHRKPASCKYKFVEIMSEFDNVQGIGVTYLQSVEGFTSVYERVEQHGLQTVISANEMHKFSHNVPSFKLTGAEREGVPPGSFELDPAAIPRAYLKAADKV